jgi:hypothetical protein
LIVLLLFLSSETHKQTTQSKQQAGNYIRRTKQMLIFQITGHLNLVPSEATCRNEEHVENKGDVGNIDSSVTGDFAQLN